MEPTEKDFIDALDLPAKFVYLWERLMDDSNSREQSKYYLDMLKEVVDVIHATSSIMERDENVGEQRRRPEGMVRPRHP